MTGTPNAPAVAIVLVTYYGDDHLARLWSSVAALDYPADRWSLTVVENDPGRRAARWFAAHAPGVRILVPGSNTGYAGGNALGMERALDEGVDYVAVVTQDTDVEPAWLRALVAAAERFPRAGALQPKILRRTPDGGVVMHSRGNELHYVGVGYVGGDGEPDRTLSVRTIGYASGAGVLFRATALRDVGVFDPAMFMYHEDTDLSVRLRLAGWEVLLAPDAVMYHDYRFTAGAEKFYLIERNRLTNVLTHYRPATLVLLAPALALFEVVVMAVALRDGWLGRRLAVYGHFLRATTWRYLARKRRAVQSRRRVPDRAFAAQLTGRVDAAVVAGGALRLLNLVLDAYWWLVRRAIVW